MGKQNPNTWYLPTSITKANRPGIISDIHLDEAAEIFQELEKRGILEKVTQQVSVAGINGAPNSTQTFDAWMLATVEVGKIRKIENLTSWDIYVLSTLRYLFTEKKIIWVALVFIVTAFLTGLFTHAGELVADAIFGVEKEAKALPHK